MTTLRQLAETASSVADTSKRTEKAQRLADLLAVLEADEIVPAIGMLTADLRQSPLGVGWATVAKASEAIEDEPQELDDPGPSITDFDRLLTDLATTSGPGSEQAKRTALGAFLAACDVETRGFAQRAITGEARLGALAGVMVDAVAKASGVKASRVKASGVKASGVKLTDLRRAVMLRGDLGQTARVALVEGAEGIATIDLEVGRPIQPMLASTAADVAEAVGALGDCSVEWKLDGARIQVHIDRRHGEEARVLVVTRNLNDVTDRLSPVVALARTLPCQTAVLDGEIIGLGPDSPQAFQDTISTFSTRSSRTGDSDEDGTAAETLRPYFFDLMHLDEVSLIDKPLRRRRQLLHDLVGDHAIDSILTNDADEAARTLQAALDAGHEGVMVKGADSVYEAGRRGKSWRKVKPVYTYDLVVLAAEWGYGRRTGWLSNLHLGARADDGDGYVMVGKTFKGLTDEILAWQTAVFKKHEDGDRSSRNTVAVKPRFVAEIAIDGVQRSTRYPGGLALRFARLKRYRDDKSPDEADTIATLAALLPAHR